MYGLSLLLNKSQGIDETYKVLTFICSMILRGHQDQLLTFDICIHSNFHIKNQCSSCYGSTRN